jgi:hypothetical protein
VPLTLTDADLAELNEITDEMRGRELRMLVAFIGRKQAQQAHAAQQVAGIPPLPSDLAPPAANGHDANPYPSPQ